MAKVPLLEPRLKPTSPMSTSSIKVDNRKNLRTENFSHFFSSVFSFSPYPLKLNKYHYKKMSSSTSSTSSSSSTDATDEEHATVQKARTSTGYQADCKRVVGHFLKWYTEKVAAGTDYNVFAKVPGSNNYTVMKGKEWIHMMTTKPAKGNALFDYCLEKRKEYHANKKMGMAHFNTVRSALLKRLKALQPPHNRYEYQGEQHLLNFFQGINKQNQTWVQANGIDDEAKVAIPFYCYEALAKSMLRRGEIKEWAYLVIQWNMMGRKCNVGDIHFNFVRWSEDMMTILFTHTKTQGGKRKDTTKFHCSTNSEAPHICPVTAVALLMMESTHEGKKLFESTAAAAAYTKAFDKCLEDPLVIAALRKAGVRPEDVASHSIRKSAATYAAGGTTAPPAAFAILLRGGWSLGDVLMRYIKMAEDQDRLLAHILAGRDIFNKTFTMLPPHFVTTPSEAVLRSCFVGEWMTTQYHELKGVLCLLLASAVNNIETLKFEQIEVIEDNAGVTTKRTVTQRLLPETHAIFQNNALHGPLHAELKGFLASGEACYKGTIMKATGIPPWAYLNIEVKDMKEKMKMIMRILQELVDIGANGGIPSAEAIAAAFKVAIMPTLTQNNDRLKNIEASLQNNERLITGEVPLTTGTEPNTTAAQHQFRAIIWQHHGKTMAPPDFTLLGRGANTVYIAVKLYYLGDTSKKISPLRFMSSTQANQIPIGLSRDDPTWQRKKAALTKNYNRTKLAALAFGAHCQINHTNKWETFCTNPDLVNFHSVFNDGWSTLKNKLKDPPSAILNSKKRKRNWNGISGPTLLKLMGNCSKGYIKELSETNVPSSNPAKKMIERPRKKGGSLTFNVRLPAASLTMQRVNVTETTTTFAPIQIAGQAFNAGPLNFMLHHNVAHANANGQPGVGTSL